MTSKFVFKKYYLVVERFFLELSSLIFVKALRNTEKMLGPFSEPPTLLHRLNLTNSPEGLSSALAEGLALAVCGGCALRHAQWEWMACLWTILKHWRLWQYGGEVKIQLSLVHGAGLQHSRCIVTATRGHGGPELEPCTPCMATQASHSLRGTPATSPWLSKSCFESYPSRLTSVLSLSLKLV